MKRTLLLALLALATLTACHHHNANEVDTDLLYNPNSATGYDQSRKMPAISFTSLTHDFGRLNAGENISYSFKFTNTGNADLIISSCDASCGCTIADYPRHRIAPGQSGYITVSFRSAGLSGLQIKEVTVAANTQPALTKLRIMAQVR